MDDRYSLPPDIAAALDRARLQVEALAQTADELQVVLPDAVGSALRDGLREEAAPISRRLAEVKGLSNQMIRRLERLETDLLAERHARVDDLALLVDLITGQWRALNERLDRIERVARRRAAHGRRRSAGPPTRASAAAPGSAATRRQHAARTASRGRPRSRASIRPPSAAESSLAIVSPSPVPPAARDERPEEPLALVRRDPGPRVLDRDAGSCRSRWPSSSVIRPPSGVARNAFESRLSTICSTRSPSETITGRARTSTR